MNQSESWPWIVALCALLTACGGDEVITPPGGGGGGGPDAAADGGGAGQGDVLPDPTDGEGDSTTGATCPPAAPWQAGMAAFRVAVPALAAVRSTNFSFSSARCVRRDSFGET